MPVRKRKRAALRRNKARHGAGRQKRTLSRRGARPARFSTSKSQRTPRKVRRGAKRSSGKRSGLRRPKAAARSAGTGRKLNSLFAPPSGPVPFHIDAAVWNRILRSAPRNYVFPDLNIMHQLQEYRRQQAQAAAG